MYPSFEIASKYIDRSMKTEGVVVMKTGFAARWMFAALVAILVAGCSKGNQGASGATGQSGAAAAAPAGNAIQVKANSDSAELAIQKVGVDPCTLLTKTDVEAALGSAPVPKRKVETLTAPSAACDWESDLSILSVRLAGPGSGGTFDKLLDKDRGHAVDGVGDKARWNPQFGSLDFVKGDRLYTLQLVGKNKDLNVATSLARGVLSRIK